ncbi:acetyltransferase domain-containing protein [Xylariaceae sp. FL0804]|nr:acetyltransferase domain-containing protein [Xylariaceae sp. FL0804]
MAAVDDTLPAEAPTPSVLVRTTRPVLPLPPNAARKPIRTARLLLEPFEPAHLEGVHALRTQPEVMISTVRGVIDRDRTETQRFMDQFLAPNDARSYNFVLRAATAAATGGGEEKLEIVGVGGVRDLGSHHAGWPEVGYLLRREHWGRGLATEFLAAFVAAWRALPREDVVLAVADDDEVDDDAVGRRGAKGVGKVEGEEGGGGSGGGGEEEDQPPLRVVPEVLWCVVEVDNPASRRVVEKNGFRRVRRWTEPDVRPGFEGKDVTLDGFILPVAAD